MECVDKFDVSNASKNQLSVVKMKHTQYLIIGL